MKWASRFCRSSQTVPKYSCGTCHITRGVVEIMQDLRPCNIHTLQKRALNHFVPLFLSRTVSIIPCMLSIRANTFTLWATRFPPNLRGTRAQRHSFSVRIFCTSYSRLVLIFYFRWWCSLHIHFFHRHCDPKVCHNEANHISPYIFS